MPLADIAEEHADVRITFGDARAQPRKVLASPEWSGTEARERRYSPFTINVERGVPWRTLTGRQQLYVDHQWMLEFGEGLPVYRPPIDVLRHVGEQGSGDPDRAEVHLRFLSPHSKWSIHSEFQDNLTMLTLFRGGPVVWLRWRTRPASAWPTTTGSRSSTATASSRAAPWSRTGSRRGWR